MFRETVMGEDAYAADDSAQPTADASSPLLPRPDHGSGSEKHTAAVLAGLGESNLGSSMINLANTIVGAGMLGLPRAFAESGYLVGSLLLVLSGFGSMVGLHLLAVSQSTVGIQPSSFYTVANAAMPSLSVLIDVAVWVKCFGVGTSYLIVVGDLMPDAMADVGVEVQSYTRDMWVLIGWIVVVPLACLRTLDALKFTSAAALFFVLFIVVFVVLFAVDTPGIPHFDPCPVINGTEPECRGSSGYLSTTPIRTLKVFSIFVFAFTCQQNIFAVCSELRDATIARIDAVITASIGVAWVVYMVVAVAGFETYGDAVKSNILVSYPVSVVVSVARIAITLLVVFSYPLQSHPARKCFLTLYIALRHGRQSKVVASDFEFYIATALFLLATGALALTVRNLGTVLGFVGATGSTAVTYILPGAIYFRLHPHSHALRYIAALQFVVGCCITPIALTFIFV